MNYGEYTEEFPELVMPDGDGWLIRHVDNIITFVEANPNAVRKGVAEKIEALKKGFRKQWANKVRQMLIPLFASNTKGAWVLRFDDISGRRPGARPAAGQRLRLAGRDDPAVDRADAQGCTGRSQHPAVQILR